MRARDVNPSGSVLRRSALQFAVAGGEMNRATSSVVNIASSIVAASRDVSLH